MACVLLLLTTVASWLIASTAMEPTHLLQTGIITSVHLTEPGDLFIATSTGSLYNVSSTELTIQNVHHFSTTICKGGLVSDQHRVFLCLCNGSCFAIENRTISLLSQDITITDSTQYVMLTFNSSLYTGSYGTRKRVPLKGIYLHNVGYASNTINRQGIYHTELIFSRRFVAGFESNGFIYFLVQDKKNSHNDIRVLKVCKDTNVSETSFRALYEAHLEDIPDFATLSLVNGQLVTIGTVTRVMISMSFKSTSVIYGVKLPDINQVMDKSFNDCITANDKKIAVPWKSPSKQEKCSEFGHQTQVTQCDFNYISSHVDALHAKLEGGIQTLLEVAGHITASLFFEYLSQQYLYIAFTNSTVSTVNKYWVFVRDNEATISAKLSNVKHLPEAVYHLVWSPRHEKVFAATNTSIYSLPVDDCSFQTSCSSCTSYQNQFCGWCVVEGHCSLQEKCINGDLNGRWIQQTSDCPHVDISSTTLSTDTSNKIVLISNTTLPTLSINETYYCLLTNIHNNITIVTPFVNSTCQMEHPPSFNGRHLNLNISLTSSLSLPFPIVVSTTNLTIINCSKIDSCFQCLTKWPNICGWCTYDMICTGTSSYCINNSSWSNSPQDKPVNQICPSLSASTSYKLSVSAVNEVVLSGFNLPLPNVISGTQYTCYLRQFNSSVLQTTAVYLNLTHLMCPFDSLNYFSELTNIFDLYVTWSISSNGHHYTLEVSNSTSNTKNVLPILFYNCTRLSWGCSFCLSQSYLLTINCVWCETGCYSNSECHNPVAMETNNCSLSIISSIFPNSGPAAGGTNVTIYGNDLPFNFFDIINIYIGSIECLLLNTSFIPGHQVNCITGASSTIGYKNIFIIFNREGLNMSTNSTSVYYLYQIPTLNSIVPAWGPVAGGTLVVVSGSFLDIGERSRTRVRVAGVFCSKLNITQSSITCVTFPTLLGSGVGQVEVIIDDFIVTLSNVTFDYRTNPSCISLIPNKIIPAGGVTLQFIGRHLTSAPRPVLIIEYNNEIYTSVCRPINDTVLTCQAPPISSSHSFNSPLLLNYRLALDNIICMSSSTLTLQLKPNPVFESVISDGTSQSGITILGNHINSVLVNEINVTVDNAVCVIQQVTAKSLYCLLPQITTTQRKYGANVTVSIANGSLVYDVGQIHYNLNVNGVTKTGTLSNLMLAIIIVVVTLVTAILMLVVAAVIVKYWKMKHPPLRNLTKRTVLRNRATTPTAKGLEISLQPSNHYCDVIERSGDIIYETIPDNIYLDPTLENQYQNCNQKTYQNVKEAVPTTAHLTLPLSTPTYSNTTLPNNRPVSELLSTDQYDHTNHSISHHSASSPDLSQSSWPSSTQNLLQSNNSEETDGDFDADIPEYTKIIKKLTPIDENRIYGKPTEKRPQLLQLPQEEYVAMHSASTTNTGSTRPSPQFDFPVVTNYIEMRSATTTPLTERPESSYVVMRSASLSSSEVKSPTIPPPFPSCYGNKNPTVPSESLLMEESQEENHVNEDVFHKNNDYIDMKLTS